MLRGSRADDAPRYDSINYDILWQTLTEDLPSLIAQLEAILADDSQP